MWNGRGLAVLDQILERGQAFASHSIHLARKERL
jgi:hypothetical protein